MNFTFLEAPILIDNSAVICFSEHIFEEKHESTMHPPSTIQQICN